MNCEKECDSNDIILEIASGFAEYKNGDLVYEDIFKRADKFMLRNKSEIKSHSKLDKGDYIDNRIGI